MKCPYCGKTQTRVVDKRDNKDDGVTRRRRECLKCFKRFTTYERIEHVELSVRKSDGRVEHYQREKLSKSVRKALGGSSVEIEQATRMIDNIEMALLNKEDTVIESSEIGKLVLDRLKELDPVAYMRFASVYKHFQSIQDFEKELASLSKEIGDE